MMVSNTCTNTNATSANAAMKCSVRADWRPPTRFTQPVTTVLSCGESAQPMMITIGKRMLVRVLRFDPLDEFAQLRFARHDRDRAAATLGDRLRAHVEPQLCLARAGVGPVTFEALVGEDRADVAIVVVERLRRAEPRVRHATGRAEDESLNPPDHTNVP